MLNILTPIFLLGKIALTYSMRNANPVKKRQEPAVHVKNNVHMNKYKNTFIHKLSLNKFTCCFSAGGIKLKYSVANT